MKIGFIGCGNMGGALALAAAQTNNELWLTDLDDQKVSALAEKTGGKSSTVALIAEFCDMIVLGVKPYGVAGMLATLKPILKERFQKPLLVSMAAGVSLEQLEGWLGDACPWIRMMPNTPVQIGKGLILYSTKNTDDAGEKAFLTVFEKAGELIPLEEKYIDAGSALSGCGPAFAYLFVEALADGGVACGLPRDLAIKLAAGTVAGAGEMVLQTGAHPGALKDAVCSPGGSTIEGVAALEENAFRSAAIQAVERAYDKTKKLGK